MGATDRLLNADHEEIYFKGMPMYNGKVMLVDSEANYLIFILVLYRATLGYEQIWQPHVSRVWYIISLL